MRWLFFLFALVSPAYADDAKPGEKTGPDQAVLISAHFVEVTITEGWPPWLAAWVKPEAAENEARVLSPEDREGFLEETGRADLLSAPQVLTRSGQQASIEVLRKLSYATAIESRPLADLPDEAIKTGAWEAYGETVVRPAEMKAQSVGITFAVKPVIQVADNKIVLDLRAEHVADPTWEVVELPFDGVDGVPYQYPLRVPVFRTRSVESRVTLSDRHAVLLASSVVEERVEVMSKIAVLGHIPILGRIFTSRKTRVDKKVLLVLVTASIQEG
jgi:type II secretory pathway component GspD/PulD (secretin)